jgi:hypothetical protein
MRRATAILGAAAMVVMTAGLLAQAKPNFAGKWTMVAQPAADAGQGGGRRGGRGGRGGFGQEMTIAQDASTLTINYSVGGQNPTPVKVVYKLDGSESKNTMMGRGGQMEQVSKAAWQGNTLVITTTTQNGEQKRVLSMDGANLKIVTTNPGNPNFGDGQPTTTTTTYTKG